MGLGLGEYAQIQRLARRGKVISLGFRLREKSLSLSLPLSP